MKYLWIIASLLAVGCGSKSDSTTASLASRSNQLIASNGIYGVPEDNPMTAGDRKRLDRHYPNTLKRIDNQQPLNLQDIINMTRSGLTDNAIVSLITSTGSIFYLTPDDETELEQAGVSFRVIDAMKETTGTSFY